MLPADIPRVNAWLTDPPRLPRAGGPRVALTPAGLVAPVDRVSRLRQGVSGHPWTAPSARGTEGDREGAQ